MKVSTTGIALALMGSAAIPLMVMCGFAEEPAFYDRHADPHAFTVFMREGGWCWYQDPRVILHEDKPFMGSAKGNGKASVFVSIIDAHPRNYGNSIYYFEFRNGNFYKANGTLIKDLDSGGPLVPSESELIYRGTGDPGRGASLSVIGAAWTSSIAIDGSDHPHIGYTLYNSNVDHRYRLAS